MNQQVTASRFLELKAKLRELFELDKSDLDFGIYRIMAAKNKEVTDFLDRQLKNTVQQTLSNHGAKEAQQAQVDLDNAVKGLMAGGLSHAQIDEVAKIVDLRSRLANVQRQTAELEADIYNHLLAFFSRYYDEGDFISRRRYKGDTYAIPYSGEEVTLHWANKDQYYIKSGEWHKDYRFTVGGRSVRFQLVEASQETNNNKEADDARRRYILRHDQPVAESDAELVLSFEFRTPTEVEKQAVVESTRIFGGKFDSGSSRSKGDEREQFCADAEQRALAAASDKWGSLLSQVVTQELGRTATDTKPQRSILGKHLDHFTSRNTFDYFIHKDLAGFLTRELDFYIKNEVVRLDDLATLPEDHLARVQGKVGAIRKVALSIIGFLASVENFQKKIWLKKKFVLETNWLVTLDRIPKKLLDDVASNQAQWQEWEKLGFKPEPEEDKLITGPAWGTRDYLKANNKLVIDTALFSRAFTIELMASQEILSGAQGVDEAITGILISSDNFQALNTIKHRYCKGVGCIYIDPPYNTSASSIIYKNDYKDSSWLSLIHNRIIASQELLRAKGITCIAIDDIEYSRMRCMLDGAFGSHAILGVIVVRSNPAGRSTPKGFAEAHEYAVFLASSEVSEVGRIKRNEKQLARYSESDEHGAYEWVNFRKHGGREAMRSARPRMFYPIFCNQGKPRIPKIRWDQGANEWVLLENPSPNDEIVYPINSNGEELRWKWGVESCLEYIQEFSSKADQYGKSAVYMKSRINNEGMLPTTWWDDKNYSATEYGTNLLKHIFGSIGDFSFPKALQLVKDSIRVSGGALNSLVLDYFAGSGTTGHAIVDLNREDGGSRKFILVEMGAYFHSVLKPRITKVIYSPEWKDGKAKVHGQGVSALVKYFALESYEDALNNLPAPSGDFLPGADGQARDAMITYSLDLELGPSLLNLDAFTDPWGYVVQAQPAGAAQIAAHNVDLVETFNYLLGLRVREYGLLERFSGEFEQAHHADGLGRIKPAGRLRSDKQGVFVFQKVSGELADGTRVLVVWRKLTPDPDRNAAALEWWMNHRAGVQPGDRSAYRDFDVVYINGPVTLEQPTQEMRTIYPIEQTFFDRMFEDTGEP